MSRALTGVDMDRQRRVSVGFVAQGAFAVGVIAMGGVSVGIVAIGGVAIGVIAIGGISVGALALGGIGIGLKAYGALAFGLWAAQGAIKSLTASLFPMAFDPRAQAGSREEVGARYVRPAR